MYEELFLKMGLSVREIKVYTLLLAEGELMAAPIAKRLGMIRTNTYDVLASLIKKGLVAYVVKNGKKYFRATDPEKILDYLAAQRRDLDDLQEKVAFILPKFQSKHQETKAPVIEIYEGKEGLKTILAMSLRESLKTKKEILGISVQQEKCRILAGPYHVRWYNERELRKIKSRYLMSSEEQILPVAHTQFKVLPKDAKNPQEIFIFGNVTSQFFFTGNLFTAIIIKHEEITKSYRAYFDFLWKLC